MERALVAGLQGETESALRDLEDSARRSRRLGDRKEHARNLLYQARVLQVGGRPCRSVLSRALRSFLGERYLVPLRKESGVALPLLAELAKTGPGPLYKTTVGALPEALRRKLPPPVAASDGRAAFKDARSRPPSPLAPRRSPGAPSRPPHGPPRPGHAPPLRIHLLNEFRAEIGPAPLVFPRRAAETLVAYLALRPGEAVRREALAELLWPGAPARASRNRFDVTLSAARRLLEPQAGPRGPFHRLPAESGWCRLSEEGLWTDVREFEERAGAGERFLGSPGPGPWTGPEVSTRTGSRAALAEARETLRRAVQAYPGDLLPHVAGLWVEPVRARLRDRHLRCLTALSSADLRLGRLEESADAAGRALAADPLHEDALRLLLSTLLRRGERASALRAYRTFARRLRRELGTDPDPETTALLSPPGGRRASGL
jgi:DNA-binding SARP family transcriptional activator